MPFLRQNESYSSSFVFFYYIYNRLSLELLFSIICTKTFCLQRTLSVIRNFNDSLIYNKYGDIQAFFSFVCLMSIFLSINKWMVYKTRQLFMITKKLSSAHSRLISTSYKTFNNARGRFIHIRNDLLWFIDTYYRQHCCCRSIQMHYPINLSPKQETSHS